MNNLTVGLTGEGWDASSRGSLLILLLCLPIVTWSIWSYLTSPIRTYSCPFLAKFTNLWRLFHVSRGNSHLVIESLHKKYGPIVRVGPNIVDVALPELVKSIFSITKGDWMKTELYHGSSALVNGKIVYNLFSQTDPAKHAAEKRPIAKYCSVSGIAPLEGHMDKIIELFCQGLETRFVDGGKACDLDKWLLYYTWDVVGSVTFSQPIGYLEKGYDFDGTLACADKAMDYFAVVGMMPFLDYWFDKNPVFRIGPPGFRTITGISVQHLIDRYQGKDGDYHDARSPDFLDKFIEAKAANPDSVDDGQIISWLMINMIAGADTTAITLRSAFYFSLRNRRVWRRLQAETLAAGLQAHTPVAYRHARALPYAEAVVREALRMLPEVSMSLERYVPGAGFRLPTSNFLPGGVIVGMNPYVLSRDESVFGEDAQEFRPERWLRGDGESEEAFSQRLAAMNAADLSFGGGTRSCIGKNMGLFQVYKVLATLVARFDMELVDPKREWKVTNSWFPRQEGIQIKITRRVYL